MSTPDFGVRGPPAKRFAVFFSSLLGEVVLALGAASQRLDKVDIAWLNADQVERAGLSPVRAPGGTPVASLRERHAHIERLDCCRLIEVARLVADALAANQYLRMTERQVRALVRKAVQDQRVALEVLQEDVREAVRKELDSSSD